MPSRSSGSSSDASESGSRLRRRDDLGRTSPCSARPASSTWRTSRGRSTATRSPLGCRTSSGTRRRTGSCSGLPATGRLGEPAAAPRPGRAAARRPALARFIDAFLDYWLDLEQIDATTPDAALYPDYYLDDLLKESALEETAAFFAELVRRDLPARNLVDCRLHLPQREARRPLRPAPGRGVGLATGRAARGLPPRRPADVRPAC